MLDTVKAVLFDAVGTLIYSDPTVPEAYARIGQRHGSSLSPREIATRFRRAYEGSEWTGGESAHRDIVRATPVAGSCHRPATDHAKERARWKRIVAEVFDDVSTPDGALFQDLWDHFADSRSWSLFDDVMPVWDHLQIRNRLVGVASNFDDRITSVCRGIPALDRCQHLFWSAEVGYPKPSPHFFGEVQRRLHLPPGQILLVGDDPVNDFYGAQAAGWHALLLDRTGGGGAQPVRPHDAYRIRSLTELLPRLASWPG